jgi:hypothetical protein
VSGLTDLTPEQQPAAHAAPHARTAPELERIIEAERRGVPFLHWRDSRGIQHLFSLHGSEHATVGRRSSNDVVLSGDGEVSRTHAQLELIGEDWMLSDVGPSRNGTYLNGVRIAERRRLSDGDLLRFGRTVVEYRSPTEGSSAVTTPNASVPDVGALTTTQRRILVALCRPYRGPYATPATNNQIAGELYLGVDAVKNHLRVLYQRFGIAALPQNQKRARLVEFAFQLGLVSERDL